VKYLFIIVAVVVVLNFYMLFSRRKKSRAFANKLKEERIASEKQVDDTRLKLDHEQARFARRAELQDNTFKLYEQVRAQGKPVSGESNAITDSPIPGDNSGGEVSASDAAAADTAVLETRATESLGADDVTPDSPAPADSGDDGAGTMSSD